MTTLACFGEECLRVSEGTSHLLAILVFALIIFLVSRSDG